MKKTLFCLLLNLSAFSSHAADYNHPGQKNFVELGYLKTNSTYGYTVYTAYGVPRIIFGKATLEGFRLNYDVISTVVLKFGPMIAYNFKPYDGSEIKTLQRMKRSGYFDAGALMSFSLPMGELFLTYARATHQSPQGDVVKIAYGTAFPLIPMRSNHMWLNVMLEYAHLSSQTATYLFGVRKDEQNADRSAYELPGVFLFTSIFGLWTPLGNNFWLNMTYKVDNYENSILRSPIIKRDKDTALMAGLMYSF